MRQTREPSHGDRNRSSVGKIYRQSILAHADAV